MKKISITILMFILILTGCAPREDFSEWASVENGYEIYFKDAKVDVNNEKEFIRLTLNEDRIYWYTSEDKFTISLKGADENYTCYGIEGVCEARGAHTGARLPNLDMRMTGLLKEFTGLIETIFNETEVGISPENLY